MLPHLPQLAHLQLNSMNPEFVCWILKRYSQQLVTLSLELSPCTPTGNPPTTIKFAKLNQLKIAETGGRTLNLVEAPELTLLNYTANHMPFEEMISTFDKFSQKLTYLRFQSHNELPNDFEGGKVIYP